MKCDLWQLGTSTRKCLLARDTGLKRIGVQPNSLRRKLNRARWNRTVGTPEALLDLAGPWGLLQGPWDIGLGLGQVHWAQVGHAAASPLLYWTTCGGRAGQSCTLTKLVLQDKTGQEPHTVGFTSRSLHCAPGHFRQPGDLVVHPSPNPTPAVSSSSGPTATAVRCTGPSWSGHKLICFNRCLRLVIHPLPHSDTRFRR